MGKKLTRHQRIERMKSWRTAPEHSPQLRSKIRSDIEREWTRPRKRRKIVKSNMSAHIKKQANFLTSSLKKLHERMKVAEMKEKGIY